MASALVEQAVSRGISQIGWHCYARNSPSVATARKVGFEKAQDYAVYLFYLDPVTHLAVHGYDCLENQQYAQALDWYQRAFDQGQAPDWAYWEAACAAARLGQNDAALAYLSQAIDAGFTQLEHIKNSPHLKSLHPTQAWQVLIEWLTNRSIQAE
jgi:tetratricopeptide (TPR) repeat protein